MKRECKRKGCIQPTHDGYIYCGSTCRQATLKDHGCNYDEPEAATPPALNLDPCAREGCDKSAASDRSIYCSSKCVDIVDEFFGGAKTPALKDMKESLGARSKPDITHVRLSSMVYESRAKEYGSDKYERANYLREVADMAAAFRRYRDYLRADLSHTVKNLDAMEKHLANDPNLEDLEGMKAAAYSADTDAGLNFPASGLPHIAHGAASKSMAITQAVDAGLLPEDPGQPWKDSGD